MIKDPDAQTADEKFGPGSQYTGIALEDTTEGGTVNHFQFIMNEARDGIFVQNFSLFLWERFCVYTWIDGVTGKPISLVQDM